MAAVGFSHGGPSEGFASQSDELGCIQALLRDAAIMTSLSGGLKPTATVIKSLCDCNKN